MRNLRVVLRLRSSGNEERIMFKINPQRSSTYSVILQICDTRDDQDRPNPTRLCMFKYKPSGLLLPVRPYPVDPWTCWNLVLPAPLTVQRIARKVT